MAVSDSRCSLDKCCWLSPCCLARFSEDHQCFSLSFQNIEDDNLGCWGSAGDPNPYWRFTSSQWQQCGSALQTAWSVYYGIPSTKFSFFELINVANFPRKGVNRWQYVDLWQSQSIVICTFKKILGRVFCYKTDSFISGKCCLIKSDKYFIIDFVAFRC